MKKLLLGLMVLMFSVSSALSADPVDYVNEPAPPVYAGAYNWSGPYAGVYAGWGQWNNSIGVPSLATTVDGLGGDGGVAGFLVGYNQQFGGNFVVGAQGEYGWSSLEINNSLFGGAITADGDVDWTAALSARLGWTPVNSALFYLIGGWSWMGADAMIGIGGVGTSFSQDYDGWHAGLGAEVPIRENILLRVEGRHTDYGSENWGSSGLVNVDATTDVITAAVVYKFSGNPFRR